MTELTCKFVSASTNTTTTTRKRKINSSSTSRGGGDNDQMPHHHQHYLINPQHQQQVHHQENVSSHNHNHNYYFPASGCRSTKLPLKLDHQLLISTDHVCVKKSVEENRLNQSGAGASTSGQRSSRYHDDDAVVLLSAASPQLVPLPPQHSQHHLTSSYSNYLLIHQNPDDEIDALIRLQHETLRSVLVDQTQQRRCRLLMSDVLEQQVQRRLKEKQIELENAWGRHAELEEKIKQMSSENQMWFNVANNNEAMVLSLRSTLEHHQLILNLHHHHEKNQNTTTKKKKAMGPVVEEAGFGDSSAHGVLADDAQSSNINNNCHQQQLQVNVGEREYKTVSSSNVDVRDHDVDDAPVTREHQQQQQHRKMCKVCKEMEVSVLLLPCRHLCLCMDCEPKLQACPICNSFKNASLQIFMS